MKGGKSKICAVFVDGETFQDVLTAEAWGDADQAHAQKVLKPLLGEVVTLENGKITPNGKTIVFCGKRIKLSFDKETVVKKVENNEKYGDELPLLKIAECSKLSANCAVCLLVCVQSVSGPHNRRIDGIEKPVSNLQVACEGTQIDAAFWGHQLATEMGEAKRGDVFRFKWMTLLPLNKHLFKLTSNSGTQVERVEGGEAEKFRGEVNDTLTSMSPTYGVTRAEKMNLPTTRMSLSLVAHMREADLGQDNSNPYKGAVMIPSVYIKEIRSLGDSSSGMPYYHGCPQCKKALKSGGICEQHGKVTPMRVDGALVTLQDPTGTFEATLWKDAFDALRNEFEVPPSTIDEEVLPLLVQKTSCYQFVARMGVGMNKNGNKHYVDLFDLSSAVSEEGMLVAFRGDLPSLPSEQGGGLAPLCCQHLHQDDMGQLHAICGDQRRGIDGAMCTFRVSGKPDFTVLENVDGLIVKVKAVCSLCKETVTLQKAGVPQSVQQMVHLRENDLVLANVILQSDGKQPFEVNELQIVDAGKAATHEKLQKFQGAEYQKFVIRPGNTEITTTPSKEVHDLFSTPRQAKRLNIQHTGDIAESK